MRRFLMIASALALLGACSSGDGGCGGSDKPEAAGQSSSMPGGGGSGGRGLGETVSFQGLGRKAPPPPAQQGPAPAQAQSPAQSSAEAGASGGGGAQVVICGGFRDLPADCLKAPAFDAIKKKCCPSGRVEACQAIPGGARLTGRGCTASAR